MPKQKHTRSVTKLKGVEKCPTGIRGLDEITAGGERIWTGVERPDAMMGGQGCYRGSSILISGAGKTGLAAGERNRSHANRGISLNAILQFLGRVLRRRLTTVFDPAKLGIRTGFVPRGSVR